MKKMMTRSALALAMAIALVGCGNSNNAAESTAPADASAAVEDTTAAVEETTAAVEESTAAESSVEKSTEAAAESTKVDYVALKGEMEDKGDGLFTKTNEDGSVTYLKEMPIDEHGWAPVGTLTVDKDAKTADYIILESSFDYINEEGKRKSDDQDYIEAMKKGGDGKDIGEALAFYSDYLKTSTDLEAIPADVITGATHTAENFKLVAGELLKAANIAK
ncbi:MAG: hypothetical protein PUJ57_06460 [Peptoniphilaceae bacterium]|nr:hypothetical protein [Peptoniphilaceae bacterium]MDY6085320.1 hypothetical protein [Peptoniphilaceae bacterium]